MRVSAISTPAVAATAPAARREGRATFQVGAGEPGRSAAPTAGPRAIASLDALIALQSVEDATERRRRIARRGQRALDALEELKLSLLAGGLDPAAMARLQSIAGALAEPSGDDRLDGVMAEIGLRAAVEIAKFSRR